MVVGDTEMFQQRKEKGRKNICKRKERMTTKDKVKMKEKRQRTRKKER